jgi:uncharacterized protein
MSYSNSLTPETTEIHEAHRSMAQEKNQYTLWQIIGIWLAGGIPMWALGWLAYPALSRGLPAVDAGLLRLKLFTLGLIWQFLLSMLLLYREEGNLRLATIRRRFWLNGPVSPKTGKRNNWLWWLLIPFILLVAASELAIAPALDGLWVKLFPILAEPPGYSAAALFTPEMQSHWIGAWSLFIIFCVEAVFNTFLGEEFLFRGVLLPRMNGVFGKWDWLANGIFFGLYHLHQPWGLPGNILFGLLVAFIAKRYRTNWFPIILHSAQSIYFGFLILGLVLGLA